MNVEKSARMGKKFTRLEQALSAEGLSSRFETELKQLWKRPISLTEFSIPRVFPGRDGGFIIQYRMSVSDVADNSSSVLILGGLLLADTAPVPSYITDNREGSFFLGDLRLAVPLFPFDPELEHLPAAYRSPEQLSVVRQAAAKALGSRETIGKWKSELLAYRMGKRCVFRISLDSDADNRSGGNKTELILKLLRPKKTTRALDALNFLARHGLTPDSADRIAVPSLLAADESAGIFLTTKAPGRSLHDLTGDSIFGESCEAAALALRKLHKLPTGDFPVLSMDSQLTELGEKACQAGNIFPDYNPLFKQAWSIIEAGRSVLSDPFELTCIHSDFYDKQLFVDDGFVTILDTDSLSAGDPAVDIGNFMAHLYLRSQQEPKRTKNILNGLESFKSVFFRGSKPNLARIRYWEGAALLRLATLYAIRPRWQKLTVTLLRRAIDSLSTDSTVQTVGKRG